MSESDLSKAAALALKGSELQELPDDDQARRSTIAAMEQALLTRAQAPRRAWVLGFAVAAGLVLVASASWVAWSMRRPTVVSTTVVASASSVGMVTAPRQAPHPLVGGAALAEMSRVTTSALGAAQLEFSTGTKVMLAESSDVTLDAVDARQRLYLASGRLDAHVAHVAKGSSFQVATRDAEVEVKGTVFKVEVVPGSASCSRGTTTRVAVEEGVVVVRFGAEEAFVHAGEKWPKDCETVAPPEPVVVEPSPEPSSLAAQNDLFAQASLLKRRGEVPGAIALYEHLLDAWPNGPLAEGAAVERMKLVAEQNRGEGVKAARAYLVKYPRGFAKDEARRISDSR